MRVTRTSVLQFAGGGVNARYRSIPLDQVAFIGVEKTARRELALLSVICLVGSFVAWFASSRPGALALAGVGAMFYVAFWLSRRLEFVVRSAGGRMGVSIRSSDDSAVRVFVKEIEESHSRAVGAWQEVAPAASA